MRVIAGYCRGRRLKSVKGFKTRPTADRVKEAVFNVLGFRVQNSYFLDLFAGTGNIGIEAISRGCALAVFVEKDRNSVLVINDNFINFNIMDKAQVFPLDCFKALNLFHTKNMKFNLVYLDPPYKLDIINDILENLVTLDLLNDKAIVMAETSLDSELPLGYEVLIKAKENRYGDTKITYYQLNGEV